MTKEKTDILSKLQRHVAGHVPRAFQRAHDQLACLLAVEYELYTLRRVPHARLGCPVN